MSDWDREVEKERLAREIKRKLFQPGEDEGHLGGKSVNVNDYIHHEERELEFAMNQLEESMNRIPGVRHEGNNLKELDSNVAQQNNSTGPPFGSCVEDIFAHSWRPILESKWIWVPKPVLLGGISFPARSEEIRREGWRAKRLTRVPPPRPIDRSFACAVREGKMRGDPPRPARWSDQLGGSKRSFEEDRRGGNQEEWDRRDGGFGDGAQREMQLRDRLQGAWDNRGRGQQTGNFRGQRGEGYGAKRREVEPWIHDQRDPRSKPPAQGNFTQPSAHDRLGGKIMEGGTRGKFEDARDLQSDGGRGAARTSNTTVCRWCGQEGHFQATCTNKPLCFRCNTSGHVASQCPQAQGCKIKMMGFGFPGHGFYSLQIPDVKTVPISENLACVTVESGVASSERIEEELKHLVDDKWDWKVRQLSDQQYLVEFPNKMMLTTLSKSNGVHLAIHNIFVKITKSTVDASASSTLQTGWVKIYNIHPKARTEEGVKAIAELAGEFEVVDELSLIRDGPVRVKISGRNINSLRGFVEIFVGKVGQEVKFVAEGAMLSQAPKQPPPHKHYPDSEEEEDETDRDNDLEFDKRRRNHEKERQEEPRENNKDSHSQKKHSRGDIGQKETESTALKVCSDEIREGDRGSHILAGKIITTCQEIVPVNLSEPLEEVIQISQNGRDIEAVSSQEMGLVEEEQKLQMKFSSILEKQPSISEKQSAWEDRELGAASGSLESTPLSRNSDKFFVHDGEEGYWLEKSKWPRLELEKEKVGATTQEHRSMEGLQSSATKGDTEWQRPQSASKRARTRKHNPVIADRRSERIYQQELGGGTTQAGLSGTSSTNPNPFAVLNSLDDDFLENLALDCDIILGGEGEGIRQTLDAMRLEELARAALAEANYNDHNLERLSLSHVLEGENLDLSYVSNSHRGFSMKKKVVRNTKRGEGG
ncbi:unnamed protein product [Urochloa decumbens]|uniref:CCHC-type domain-containing protein n=1 Tax=Urochloa decumbens TaxID=240449 RepID=A0ABC9FZB5_9POAL